MKNLRPLLVRMGILKVDIEFLSTRYNLIISLFAIMFSKIDHLLVLLRCGAVWDIFGPFGYER